MDNPSNRRIIIGVVVAIAIMFGVLSLATMSSYNQGFVDGMSRGTQIVAPINGVQVMPATQAPFVYQQPQVYSQPAIDARGFGGFCMNALIFFAVIFVITRIFKGMSGHRRWGHGQWSHGDWRDWHNGPPHGSPRNKRNDFRNTPNQPDEQVI